MKQKGHGLTEVKRLNCVKIKQIIYKNAPITRVEVSEILGLTLPTITTAVATMLLDGILVEQPVPEVVVNPLGGRRPLALEYNAHAAYALGVELGPYNTTVCAIDLLGNMLIEHAYDPAPADYSEMLTAVTAYVNDAAKQLPVHKILGTGVGLPGFIESDRGVIRSNARADWNGHNLAHDLADALHMPVVVDNNVRMRATGEELFAKDWRPDIFAYFYISKGIACPLMVKDDVVAGYTAGAGEIGHTTVQRDGPVCPTCGHQGCLDALAGETAILAKCQALCDMGKAPILRRLLQNDSEGILEMKTVLAAQNEGDSDVDAVLQEVMEYLGVSLANVVNLISPGLVVVEGYIMKNSSNRTRLLEAASRHLYGLNASEVKFEFLPFFIYRGAKGSAARVLRKEFLEK